MTPEQYYIAPPQKVFDEIKNAAMQIWSMNYDGDYRKEKLQRILHITNCQDNAWYMVAMFDRDNQMKLLDMVSDETHDMIIDAMSPN